MKELMTKDKLLGSTQCYSQHTYNMPLQACCQNSKDLQNVTEIQNNFHTEGRNEEKRGREMPKNGFCF